MINHTSGDCNIQCNNNGVCTSDNICVCAASHNYAPDCSLMVCPKGKAWSDKPYQENQGHSMIECSNRGACDRKTVSYKSRKTKIL